MDKTIIKEMKLLLNIFKNELKMKMRRWRADDEGPDLQIYILEI